MIHAYHVIWGTYGFWLPNDPRGSWSDFVYAWELAKFGQATRSLNRVDVEPKQYAIWRNQARSALKHPAVTLTGLQAMYAGQGFSRFADKSNLHILACSILPEHIHLVIARHRYKIETAANLLKGEASRRLREQNSHPMTQYMKNVGDRLPSMWAEGQWKVYLDHEEAVEAAIHYVNENPVREGRPEQKWKFVKPFQGIDKSSWTTYH